MQPDEMSAEKLLALLNKFTESLEPSPTFRLRIALEIVAIELAKMRSLDDDWSNHQPDKSSE